VVVGPAYLRSLANLWKHPPIGKLQVHVNRRFTAIVGRCLASRDLIEISPAVASRSARVQREILCHEAAHLVVWARYGRAARPHGHEWGELVEKAGFHARATLVRCGEPRRRAFQPVRFRHVCPVCHFSKRAKRRMPVWRCPECRALGLAGTLLIERLSDR
jgi:predicted SprT family Zn-dependent metalloprotease